MKTGHPPPRPDRATALDLTADEFRTIGHALVDSIASHFDALRKKPVTTDAAPSEVRSLLGDGPLPSDGSPAEAIFRDMTSLLFSRSLFTGHPRFWAYITGSPAPAGVLADLLASSVNPNVGAWPLSPVATEVELQAVRWLAELVGYPADCGGILVSGGNMANFVGFLAARRAHADWDLRSEGMQKSTRSLTLYASTETHTWIHKAAELFGLGTNAIRWVPTDDAFRMDIDALRRSIAADRADGHRPFLVIGAGGTVSTGAVDPLDEIADICEKEGLWFHVDGAYGAPAAATHEAPPALKALARADSVALDPHKWLYCPMEAGCALVRSPEALMKTFSFRPEYYRFEGADGEIRTNLFEYGMQNSRGFRALKVWMQLRQAGRNGLVAAIEDDIRLARRMASMLRANPSIEVRTENLSIVTFRYVPATVDPADRETLNELNTRILDRVQQEGRMYVSNAVLNGTFYMRACIVNFRTTADDVDMVPGIVADTGAAVEREFADRRKA